MQGTHFSAHGRRIATKGGSHFRPDPAFAYGLNVPGVFTGTIYNREYIGKTSDDLVLKYNEGFPDDQVQVSAN